MDINFFNLKIDLPLGFSFSLSSGATFSRDTQMQQEPEAVDPIACLKVCPECDSTQVQPFEMADFEDKVWIALICPDCSWRAASLEVGKEDVEVMEEILEGRGIDDEVARFSRQLGDAGPDDIIGD